MDETGPAGLWRCGCNPCRYGDDAIVSSSSPFKFAKRKSCRAPYDLRRDCPACSEIDSRTKAAGYPSSGAEKFAFDGILVDLAARHHALYVHIVSSLEMRNDPVATMTVVVLRLRLRFCSPRAPVVVMHIDARCGWCPTRGVRLTADREPIVQSSVRRPDLGLYVGRNRCKRTRLGVVKGYPKLAFEIGLRRVPRLAVRNDGVGDDTHVFPLGGFFVPVDVGQL